LATLVLR